MSIRGLPFGPAPRMPDFTPSAKHEHARDGLSTWSEANWAKVDPALRARVGEKVRSMAPADMLAQWRDQHQRGVAIGSDYPRFHLDVGMQIRNACRTVLADDGLPEVNVGPVGEPYGPARNWDDYYFGVLAAIAA